MKTYFNYLQLVYETVNSAEDEAGFEVPFHDWLVFEVSLQSHLLGEEYVSIDTAHLESVSKFLQSFIWLHAKNLFRHKIVCLRMHTN